MTDEDTPSPRVAHQIRVVYEIPLGDDVYGHRTVETIGLPPPHPDAAIVPDPNRGVSFYVQSMYWIVEDPAGPPYVGVRLFTAKQYQRHRLRMLAGKRDG